VNNAVDFSLPVAVGLGFRRTRLTCGEHPRKLPEAVPQLPPAFERLVERYLFLFDVREACTLHLLGSGVETFGAFVIHRKKAECLRERYTISSGMEKFNVRVHFSKNCTQSHCAERSLGGATGAGVPRPRPAEAPDAAHSNGGELRCNPPASSAAAFES
jgi:hypothetical protein